MKKSLCPLFHQLCLKYSKQISIILKGKIVAWRKKIGEKINAGDVLADIETDKATIDFVFQDDGYLAKILVPEGSNVPVGQVQFPILQTQNQVVCIVVDNKDAVKQFENIAAEAFTQAKPAAQPQAQAQPKPEPKPQPQAQPKQEAPKPQPTEKPKPQAQAKQAQATEASSYVDIPVSNMRDVIAKRLLESKTTIPHYYLEMDIVMDNLIK